MKEAAAPQADGVMPRNAEIQMSYHKESRGWLGVVSQNSPPAQRGTHVAGAPLYSGKVDTFVDGS